MKKLIITLMAMGVFGAANAEVIKLSGNAEALMEENMDVAIALPATNGTYHSYNLLGGKYNKKLANTLKKAKKGQCWNLTLDKSKAEATDGTGRVVGYAIKSAKKVSCP